MVIAIIAVLVLKTVYQFVPWLCLGILGLCTSGRYPGFTRYGYIRGSVGLGVARLMQGYVPGNAGNVSAGSVVLYDSGAYRY